MWYDWYDCCKHETPPENVVSIFMCYLYFALHVHVFVSSTPTIVWNHFNLFFFAYLVNWSTNNLFSCNWLYIFNNSCKHDPPRLA